MAFFGFGRKAKTTSPAPKASEKAGTPGKPIGKVSHFYDKLGVAIVDLKSPLSKGDMVKFVRDEEQFEQMIDSIQLDHKDIDKAGRGKSVGVKVTQKVHEGAMVYKTS